jgi:hypothetical protein
MKLYLEVTDFDRSLYSVNQDLNFFAGEDEILDLFFLDEYEDNLNIVGATIYFIVKDKPSDTDANAKLNKSYASSTFPNPGAGEGAITLLADWTKDFLGNYVYQILIKFQGDIPIKVAAEGTITFKRKILIAPSSSTPYSYPPYGID